MGSTIWSIFIARRYVKRGICRRRVSAGFVLTIASRGPSAIAELLVEIGAFFCRSPNCQIHGSIIRPNLPKCHRPLCLLNPINRERQHGLWVGVIRLREDCRWWYSGWPTDRPPTVLHRRYRFLEGWLLAGKYVARCDSNPLFVVFSSHIHWVAPSALTPVARQLEGRASALSGSLWLADWGFLKVLRD